MIRNLFKINNLFLKYANITLEEKRKVFVLILTRISSKIDVPNFLIFKTKDYINHNIVTTKDLAENITKNILSCENNYALIYSLFSKMFSKVIEKQFGKNIDESFFNDENINILRGLCDDCVNIVKNYFSLFKTILSDIIDDKKQDYVTNADDLDYIEFNKSGNRRKMTLGRYFTKETDLPKNFPTQILTHFVNDYLAKIKLYLSLDQHIQEFSGDELQEFYESHDTVVNTWSCMVGDSAKNVELFKLNPERVKIVTYKYKTRALLWTCDDGTKVLDRVYPAGSEYVAFLRNAMLKRGCILRENPDKLVTDNVALSDGSSRNITMIHEGIFPYLDTFKYGKVTEGDLEEGTIVFSNINDDADIKCKKTDGTAEFLNKKYSKNVCTNCGNIVDEDDNYSNNDGDIFCESCYNDLYLTCDECSDSFLLEDYISVSSGSVYCPSCFSTFYKKCASCGEFFNRDDIYSCWICDDYVCLDDSTTVEDEICCIDCFEKKCDACSNCGDNYRTTQLTDGLCDNCESIEAEEESAVID